MIPRIANCSRGNSFFLFGARATGKTSYLESQWAKSVRGEVLWIDLLKPEVERELGLRPSSLEQQIEAMEKPPSFVVIDEVQKVPKLLDVVHRLIQKKGLRFALTGSSARKLKRGASNLLAGRAFLYKLFPLTFIELGKSFRLEEVMQRGSLPEIFRLKTKKDRARYLNAYVQTYLKEEIAAEQLVRNVEPFRFFLEVAGQCNGKILNYSKIAREAGIDSKSCKTYFEILEDTLIGFHLPAFSTSVRKQQSKSPKFYLFDLGVARALTGALDAKMEPATYSFGNCFEQLVILEAFRLNEYFEAGYRLSYFRSKDGAEIDLILEKGGEKILIEIKSKTKILHHDFNSLRRIGKDFPSAKRMVLSLDETRRVEDGVLVTHWQEGLKNLFKPRAGK